MSEENPHGIAETPKDRALALARSVANLAPGIGPVVADIILNQIPGQRMDRFEDFMGRLAQRLEAVEARTLGEQLREPERIDLFEEGAEQSVRAVSEQRRDHIAQIVSSGLSGDKKALIEAKRLLALLEQIDDDQMIILASYLLKNGRDGAFRERHANVLAPIRAHMGSTRNDLDAAAISELARAQLIRLGLLRARFAKPKKGELPEFDEKTGMMKGSGRELTPLGRLLLRRAGVAGADDL